jgi:hypothetical protein
MSRHQLRRRFQLRRASECKPHRCASRQVQREALHLLSQPVLDRPKTFFELPEFPGAHRFYALIRLPDYLTGTLADIGPDMFCSTDKFREMLHDVLVDSPNNCMVQLLSNGERITTRYARYRS